MDVIRIMPMYRQVIEGGYELKDTGLRLRIPVGFRMHIAEIWQTQHEPVPTFFVRRDEYFDRRALYSLPERDYTDNLERFVFFQKSVVALLDAMGWSADIVHCNDWTTGLIPLYLRHGISGTGRSGRERSVFTIHNLAYQGIFPGAEFPTTNLPFSCFTIQGMEFFGNLNCLKAGLTSAHQVTTVSPSYAEEIQAQGKGFGLEGVLRGLGSHLTGLLNGADYASWNPETDPYISTSFSADHLAGKGACRSSLMKATGWTDHPEIPILGMVSRLVSDKGMDLLEAAMERITAMPFRLVLLGSGQEDWEKESLKWMAAWPDRVHVEIGYNVRHAHRIQAGCDFFLMPSAREPGGLSQLYAMKYGTIPVVHAVGGLKDTVSDLSQDGQSGNGLVFEEYTSDALLACLERAMELYRRGASFLETVRSRIMKEDHSWDKSARSHIGMYERVIANSSRPG